MKENTPRALLISIELPGSHADENRASLQELKRLCNTLGFQIAGTLTQRRNSLNGSTPVGQGKLKEIAEWTGGSGEVASAVPPKKKKKTYANSPAEELANAERESGDFDEEFTDEHIKDSTDKSPVPSPDELLDESPDELLDESPDDLSDESPDELIEETDLGGPSPTGEKVTVVVFDCELTPSQARNLESALGVEAMDRTGVIIEIFSRHARTRTAKLQVEIARLRYIAPRLRETGGGGDRQGGGIGAKGSGETTQELDRRRIRDRIAELQDELASIGTEHDHRRTRRSESMPVAALVGYTNAGKSSLMRALTGSEVLVADKLFATLDTTVRSLHPDTIPRILMSDTVGFISKLPHDLVASFRSTLEEARGASLLLFVVDASDATFRKQLEVTRTVLSEVGAADLPQWLVLNKIDRLNVLERAALKTEFPGSVQLSAIDKTDVARMRELILGFFEKDMVEETLIVPYQTPKAVGDIRSRVRVLRAEYDEFGAQLFVRGHRATLNKLKEEHKL